MTAATWPFGTDADRDDPLTALRIPVTGTHPKWHYIATFDRGSEARPTDAEARMLASFIEEYKEYFFNDSYKAKLLKRPLDVDAVTKIFHKWGDSDWSYRVVTWQYGPFWVPVSPRLRGGEFEYDLLPAHTLEQVMDRCHSMHTEYPSKHWAEWKASHPETFGDDQ
ncbi:MULTISPECIES: hypothetical protein [unclassified Streptomyces]|uniref:hypothetical protein n=1 Tax=unclassified Streptomyces TaxID=2593676 RepID=UPI000888EE1D|nr:MULTISPECIES: hypothetical protein [unclassified Streptomyces]PBC72295.1 hypothetical protein BX261_7379 [Streptomyces sp. 2321.6]SDR62270.1 hypothetical protein SAMN05216511_7324 [Streptomyces sp. KS_16]SEE51489.1 hypothetical protein SAMN05428940_7373 [Streptomyces sp. 2133.1]SNC77799.1 hypothetical protein SAMN06272741_7215 [Streptomyces sp. 2114.4]